METRRCRDLHQGPCHGVARSAHVSPPPLGTGGRNQRQIVVWRNVKYFPFLNHCIECTPVRSPSVGILRSPPAYSERSCPSDKSIITASGVLTTVITPLRRHTATVHSNQGIAQCATLPVDGGSVVCTWCPARCSGYRAMTGIHEIFILINYSLMMGWWRPVSGVWDQRPADLRAKRADV